MRFATRLLVACWVVATSAGVARADFPPPAVAYAMMAGMACAMLTPLLALLLIAFLPSPKKPRPKRRRKTSPDSENARDDT
jgi:hypothetical protein